MKLLKRILKNERGQALPMALILLVLGGFLVVPTLALTTTNLNANRIVHQNALELYAADAGVADALWRLNNAGLKPPAQWQLSEQLNGGTVNVTLSQESAKLYKIVSTATLPGGSTTIEALVMLGGNPWFFDNAITSANDVTIQPNSTIQGKVIYYNKIVNKGTVNPAPIKDLTVRDRWPVPAEVDTFFKNLVSNAPDPGPTITIPSGTSEVNPFLLGPANRSGDLNITGNGWVKLNGTVYVSGNLTINPSGGKDINLNLNTKTLFAKGFIDMNPGVNFRGKACLVALGNVNFAPKSVGATINDYVFIMSVSGTVQTNPGGEFYGSVAGWNVDYWPKATLRHTTPPSDGLDFPAFFTYKQCTYIIK